MEGILVRLGELLVILLAAKVGSEVMARLNQQLTHTSSPLSLIQIKLAGV